MLLLTLAVVGGLTAGCVDGPCRKMKNPELANRQVSASTNVADVGSASGPRSASVLPGVTKTGGAVTDTSSKAKDTTLLVYKADGSLQCGQGKAALPTEMERQLSGIKVFSRESRSDGLMHIQMCGSPTGQINVFEIPLSSLPEALKRGFKKLES